MRALSVLLAASLIASAADIDRFFKPNKIRVLILSGRNNHDWRTTTPAIRRILDGSGRFDTRVSEEPAALSGAAVAPYDVLVSDYNGPRWGAAAESAVEKFVRSGKGLVVVHGASYAFGDLELLGDNHVRTGLREPPWPEWFAMVGAGWTETPKSGHGNRHVFPVKWVDREHPVSHGLPESFLANDELYHLLRLAPNIHVLATAYDAPEEKGTGRDEPVIWTVPYGAGRVFHMTLGHDEAALIQPGVVTALARGTEWAGSGAVTLPAVVKLHLKRDDAVRVLVLTAGHDHEPSFYSFLDNDPRLTVTVDPTGDLFQSDLRKRFDVVLFYNMKDDFDEVRRGHLREFVESGKGIVLVHHSIASFQSWEWWWKEVAGGKYFEKPDATHGASTYRHDIEITAIPVTDHPITKGIGPMQLHDEGYRNMWISPDVTVLYKAQHPDADPPLAWVSAYQKSRVVYIQPGHGKPAHDNPQWRSLVRNAIFWTAGRNP
jgi:type 1 glutamine amidotransferase